MANKPSIGISEIPNVELTASIDTHNYGKA